MLSRRSESGLSLSTSSVSKSSSLKLSPLPSHCFFSKTIRDISSSSSNLKRPRRSTFFLSKSRLQLFAAETAMSVRTVKVSNVSHSATEQDIKEFFSFSGDIDHVELKSVDEWSRVAYVTFRDFQGAETAILLSGATIVDQSVIITIASDYQPPRIMSLPPPYEENRSTNGSQSIAQKTEDVVATVLSKGYVLGKGTVDGAKSFNEKHRITSTAAAKVASFDRTIGLTEKIGAGASAVSGKVREVDQRLQVSGKTKSAITAAGEKVSGAGSAAMKNRYVFSGVSFVTGAFSKVGQAVSEVGAKTKEKVMAEQMKKEAF